MEPQVGIDGDMWATLCQLLHTETPKSCLDKPDSVWKVPSEEMWPNMREDKNPKPNKRQRVYTNKAEVNQLQAQIAVLQEQLKKAQQSCEAKASKSMWAGAAVEQLKFRNKSMQENSQLHDAIRERDEYIQHLQRIILRQPQWKVYPELTGEESRSCLPADPIKRKSALCNIANWHLSRRETAFIQAGVFGRTEYIQSAEVITLPNEQIIFRLVKRMEIPLNYLAVARPCWSAVSQPTDTNTDQNTVEESWERVDESLLYHHFESMQPNGAKCHSNVIRKYSEDIDRSVIAVVFVAKDMLVKDSADSDESCGWLAFEANPDDREKSYMTILFNCNVTRFVECDMPANAIFEVVSASLRRLYISRHNLFHAVPVLAELHEGTCREHLPIRRQVNNAIHELRRKKLATSVPVC